MGWLTGAIVAGIVSFAATNIDDIVILMLFFAQVNTTFHPKHIIMGQYLGFTAIILFSLPGFFGGLILPKAWIGFLGVVPLIIGIANLMNCEADRGEVQTVSGEVVHTKLHQSPMVASLARLLTPHTFNVAAVTLANGGDNIGIYVPLFANCNLPSLGVTLGVFYLLIGAWCSIAYWLTRQAAIARPIARYGRTVMPFVLIGLGIYILTDSGSLQLLQKSLFAT
jgi:cadmium resistance transport/sequestration family protein